MSLLVLSAADVEKVASSFDTGFLQELMGRVFTEVSRTPSSTAGGNADIQIPHRTAIDMTSHTTLFMPARISHPQARLEGTCVKVVSIPRRGDDMRGLPATTLVLNEETGAVEAVVNARQLTALRNAAGPLSSCLRGNQSNSLTLHNDPLIRFLIIHYSGRDPQAWTHRVVWCWEAS